MLADLQGQIVKSAERERVVEWAFPKPPLVEARHHNGQLSNHLQKQRRNLQETLLRQQRYTTDLCKKEVIHPGAFRLWLHRWPLRGLRHRQYLILPLPCLRSHQDRNWLGRRRRETQMGRRMILETLRYLAISDIRKY